MSKAELANAAVSQSVSIVAAAASEVVEPTLIASLASLSVPTSSSTTLSFIVCFM